MLPNSAVQPVYLSCKQPLSVSLRIQKYKWHAVYGRPPPSSTIHIHDIQIITQARAPLYFDRSTSHSLFNGQVISPSPRTPRRRRRYNIIQ